MIRAIPLACGLVTAAMVLVPYATVGLSFRSALHIQAVLLLLLTLSLLGVGLQHRGDWRQLSERLQTVRRGVLWGLGLYSAATVLGWVTAIFRGNQPVTVAGQVLSMGLLPLAAVAGLCLPFGALLRPYSRGLSGAVVFAALIHLISWASFGRLLVNQRLFFANAISVVGPALLGFMLLLAVLTSDARRARWLQTVAWLGAGCLGFYTLLAGVRGLWLVTPLALILFSLLALSRKGTALTLLVLLLVGLAGLTAWRGFDLWLKRPRPNLLPGRPADLLSHPPRAVRAADAVGAAPGAVTWSQVDGHCGWALGPPFDLSLPAGHTFRFRADFSGPVGARGYVTLQWFDAGGKLLGGVTVPSAPHPWMPAEERWAVPPAGTAAVRLALGCDPSREGLWRLRRLELHDLGGGFLAPLLNQRSLLGARFGSIPKALGGSLRPPQDPSLSFRYLESRELSRLFAAASWPRRLFGHGLGATYTLQVMGGDVEGKRTEDSRPNYIHNFYLFLLFKLGLVGTVLVLAALVWWILTALHAVRMCPPGFQRSFAAASASALVAYSIWSAASPQILDFRMAPLWGLLIAGLGRLHPAGSDTARGLSNGASAR